MTNPQPTTATMVDAATRSRNDLDRSIQVALDDLARRLRTLADVTSQLTTEIGALDQRIRALEGDGGDNGDNGDTFTTVLQTGVTGAFDLTPWTLYDSPGHAGNGYRRPWTISVDNEGAARIHARWDAGLGGMVSGGMQAMGASILYGRIRARIRATGGKLSPVMLTWPAPYGVWPKDGENNIVEVYNPNSRAQLTPVEIHLHWAGNEQAHDEWGPGVSLLDWHTYTCIWLPDRIEYYLDDRPEPVAMFRADAGHVIPSKPHNVCVQLDAHDKTRAPDQFMWVDWLTVEQLNGHRP